MGGWKMILGFTIYPELRERKFENTIPAEPN